MFAGEKDPPPVFVGREDIRTRVLHELRKMKAQSATPNSILRMEVIQGAPGVGKSSLLHRLGVDSEQEDALVIHMDAAELNDAVGFASRFLKQYSVEATNRDTARTQKHSSGFDKIAKYEYGTESSEASIAAQLNEHTNVWSIISKTIENESMDPKAAPVLLLIDEAQHLWPDFGSPINAIADSLLRCATEDFDILPIFAGLSDTHIKLAEAGITRTPHAIIRLEALSTDESASVVSQFLQLDAFELDTELVQADCAAVSQAIASASEGWPRHLHCYIQSFVAELVGLLDGSAKRPISLRKVLDRGHQLRIDYCRDRLLVARIHNASREALFEIAQEYGSESFPISEIIERGQKYGSTFIDAERDLEKVVHTGLLDEVTPGTFKIPIPSLASYMAAKGNEEKTLTNMRHNSERTLNNITV